MQMTQGKFAFRAAQEADLISVVQLLADDDLGNMREIPSLPLAAQYVQAFQAIEADDNQMLAVTTDDSGAVVGTMQISFIPGISRLGAWRGQIEAVRVVESQRNAGLGQSMFEWAISFCKSKGCRLVQLTTDKSRPDAHRFYEKLGFEPSHVGYKLNLD